MGKAIVNAVHPWNYLFAAIRRGAPTHGCSGCSGHKNNESDDGWLGAIQRNQRYSGPRVIKWSRYQGRHISFSKYRINNYADPPDQVHLSAFSHVAARSCPSPALALSFVAAFPCLLFIYWFVWLSFALFRQLFVLWLLLRRTNWTNQQWEQTLFGPYFVYRFAFVDIFESN